MKRYRGWVKYHAREIVLKRMKAESEVVELGGGTIRECKYSYMEACLRLGVAFEWDGGAVKVYLQKSGRLKQLIPIALWLYKEKKRLIEKEIKETKI
jgi:hypothetical protein